MLAARLRSAESHLARLRTLSGFAAAIVPFAAVVHLLVEGFALRSGLLHVDFAVRHLYLIPLLLVCAWWFAATVGLGTSRAEMTRRCAIVRARLRGPDGRFRFTSLLTANCAFFALTQAIEGVPIASAPATTFAICLLAAALGSLCAALLVFRLGPSLLAAALVIIAFVARIIPQRSCRRDSRPICTRHASMLFTLFRPKRPPPRSSLA